MRKQLYSLLLHASNDKGIEKMFPITVRIYDINFNRIMTKSFDINTLTGAFFQPQRTLTDDSAHVTDVIILSENRMMIYLFDVIDIFSLFQKLKTCLLQPVGQQREDVDRCLLNILKVSCFEWVW